MKKILIYILLSAPLLAFSQSIERVEPPNWWVGMEHNEIEVMLYGEDISELTAEIIYPGIKLISQKSYENNNYLFLTILISEGTIAGQANIDLKNGEETILTHAYPILSREPGRGNMQGFDATDVMYLITPDRFSNGNPENDNVEGMREKANREFKGGRHGGDIAGISNYLNYIKDMGFTSIWLNPILENDMEQYSYHGYSTTDYYKVDPRYGSNEEYKKLCDDARAKGMKIIMDIIVNHCGSFHWWMDDLPTEDWINQWPEYTGTNHRKTVILDPYATAEDKKQFTDGWFVPTMPDLNQRNASMARYLIQNSIWWIEYAGISGIRQDTYPYPDMHFMTDWTRAIMREYPGFNIVGEEWFLMPTVVSYWQKGKDNANGYTSELKSLMDFPLQHAFTKSMMEEENWHSSWNHIYEMLGQDYLYPDPMNLVIFPDNHDMSRVHAQLGEDVARTKMAITYYATTRGIPQFYYGTELLMADKTGDHGEIRSDFPGGWPGEELVMNEEQADFQAYMKNILQWRAGAAAIHSGETVHFSPQMDDVYAYVRSSDGAQVLVLLNKNDEEVELDPARYLKYFSKTKVRDVISGITMDLNGTVRLKPMTAYILE